MYSIFKKEISAFFSSLIAYIVVAVFLVMTGFSGGIMGSYIGLIFLAGAFVAIGMWTSSITDNQIVAFTDCKARDSPPLRQCQPWCTRQ